jgi:hypothetical protein
VKLLLDEDLPVDFRHLVTGHDVFTVQYMGWKGTRNGRLLALASAGGFDALITGDGNIEFQQNLSALPVAVVVLHPRTKLPADLAPLAPKLLSVLASLPPRVVVHVYP